jgi:hypothetical protein
MLMQHYLNSNMAITHIHKAHTYYATSLISSTTLLHLRNITDKFHNTTTDIKDTVRITCITDIVHTIHDRHIKVKCMDKRV